MTIYAGFCKRQIVDMFSGEVLARAGEFITADELDRVEAYADELYLASANLNSEWVTYLNTYRRIRAAIICQMFIR